MEANHLRSIASIGNGKSWCEHYRLNTSRGTDKSSEQGEEGDGIETAVISLAMIHYPQLRDTSVYIGDHALIKNIHHSHWGMSRCIPSKINHHSCYVAACVCSCCMLHCMY